MKVHLISDNKNMESGFKNFAFQIEQIKLIYVQHMYICFLILMHQFVTMNCLSYHAYPKRENKNACLKTSHNYIMQ